MTRSTVSRSTMKALWGAGGVLFVGIAAVSVAVSAWAGMVAALFLAAVFCALAVMLQADRPTDS